MIWARMLAYITGTVDQELAKSRSERGPRNCALQGTTG
jgi:hypothetical protein